MDDWKKVAFLEHELLVNLKMNRPGWPEKLLEWYDKAVGYIEDYKNTYINKISDEQERQEILD